MVIASKIVVFPAPVAPVIAYKPTSLNCSFSKSIIIGFVDFNEFIFCNSIFKIFITNCFYCFLTDCKTSLKASQIFGFLSNS